MNHSSLSHDERSHHVRHLARRGDGDEGMDLDGLAQELERKSEQLEIQHQALQESAREVERVMRRYCDLYDHLPIGLVTLDRAGRIVEANLAAAQWLRQEREKLIGGYLAWFLDAFDAGRFAAHLESPIDSGTPQSIEVTLHLKDGLLLSVELTSRLAPFESDRERRVHTAITNVTKLNQLTAVVQDIEFERQAWKQAVTQPGGTPPDPVSRFVRTLLHDHDAELSPQIKNILERTECAAVRMEATFNDLLDFCCLGREKASLDPVNLEEVMQHVLIDQRAVIQRRRAEVVVERPLPCARGARLPLEQVLANIVTSMVTRDGTAESPRIRIGAEVLEGEVVLRITDEGEVPDPRLDERSFRTFEPRQPLDSSWHAGVRLAVISRTIDRMRGRVWVDAGIGKHTRVNIGLPSV